MRAAVLEEFGAPLAVQEIDLADPKAGEVLVRLVACGVCHTDLYTASGADPSGYAPAWSKRSARASPTSRPATTW
jgi:S-(hydroxymethyl)glutathione dehydrogenase/alcohol dehydrogenase